MAKEIELASSHQLSRRLPGLIAELQDGLLERDTASRLCLLAALAGEHVLLIGPPGTAKSELARRLHSVFAGAPYFERLLTRFSTPEELFGPLSLAALEDDRYERLVDGYLPTAGIAFLDEVFKANSAILNALLTLLNEREYDNGSMRLDAPLISVIGASNEVPGDDSLNAFYDRFLLRVPVQPVSAEAFEQLLQINRGLRRPARLAASGSATAEPITVLERRQLLDACRSVALPAFVVDHLKALRELCRQRAIAVSDRRWRQLVGILKIAACSEGRAEIDELDLWLVPYVVAHEPAQLVQLQDWFLSEVAQAVALDAPWLSRAVEAFEQQLELERTAQTEATDAAAGKLALARAIGGAEDEGGLLRISSAALEAELQKRYSPMHIAARVAQVDEVRTRAAAGLQNQRLHAQRLASALRGRLWLPPDLARQMSRNVDQTVDHLAQLMARLDQTRAGFAALPLDDAATATPQPVAIDG